MVKSEFRIRETLHRFFTKIYETLNIDWIILINSGKEFSEEMRTPHPQRINRLFACVS